MAVIREIREGTSEGTTIHAITKHKPQHGNRSEGWWSSNCDRKESVNSQESEETTSFIQHLPVMTSYVDEAAKPLMLFITLTYLLVWWCASSCFTIKSCVKKMLYLKHERTTKTNFYNKIEKKNKRRDYNEFLAWCSSRSSSCRPCLKCSTLLHTLAVFLSFFLSLS